ncbi:F-box/FBD/LRR-repeat protein At1g13570-like isoform X2 [Telopea speciosissima]|uniref:F-box/FBD/LRR-repeat protein At1g13570-like isoform X2 n=1 Tax=Telopea speciosissima TaxID=54955 RepID=UPI001CC6B68F|nr:F-box/FBD/LRR-repeat protein At1g13570-like isoform X2 [Telopea speciosissima]
MGNWESAAISSRIDPFCFRYILGFIPCFPFRMEMGPCSTQDMLNNLPESILENIFSRLSMRDVVRTSVLSTKWRYKWISIPHLIFNDECIPVSNGSLHHNKLVKIINHVLLLHRGPILTFKICSSQLQTCPEIESWILYLSSNSLTKFELQVSKSERHIVPPRLFSFRQLIHLKLVGCVIVPPVSFKGFSCLTSLVFQKVTLSDPTLKCLVSTCPQLERLTLIDIDGPILIELSNPKLKYLHIYGEFIAMCLKDLRLLDYARFYATTVARPDQRRTCNISNILGSLLGIQKLVMGGWFLQVIKPCDFHIYSAIGTQSFTFTFAFILLQSLAVDDVPRRLPSTYDHLKSISLPLNAKDMKEILVAIYLLNSSPNLQELEILLWHNRDSAIVPVMDLQKAKDQLKSTFNKLRVVKFSKLFGMEIELVLIRFILANSPVLETMNIIPRKNGIEELLLKQLLQFERASPLAEVVCLDPET